MEDLSELAELEDHSGTGGIGTGMMQIWSAVGMARRVWAGRGLWRSIDQRSRRQEAYAVACGVHLVGGMWQ
jgi:hypothetical protein